MNKKTNMPLFEELLNNIQQNKARFHVPGHCQGKGMLPEFLSLAPEVFKIDLTELPGLDDLHNPSGAIARAQELTARLYGVEESYFLVNGASSGILALMLATAREGDYVLVPRNGHRSIFSGLILSGAIPVYLEPQIVPFYEFASGINFSDFKNKLCSEPAIKSVFVLNPTYYGTVSDLPALVNESHSKNIPVIVDEAHGSHFYFNNKFPVGAMACGADAAVQSVHKTGGSLTQSSWFHLQGDRIDRHRLRDSLSMSQTTSPSYLLMASLDASRQQLASNGERIFNRVLELAWEARSYISRIEGLSLLDNDFLISQGFCGLDPTRLVISVRKLGMTGFDALKILSEHYQVELEMADYYNIIAVVSLGTTREDVKRLVSSLKDLSISRDKVRCSSDVQHPRLPPVKLSPRKAWMASSRYVDLIKSIGLISAEIISVYPPGIPVICPGEEITPDVIDYLLMVRRLGLRCQGAGDVRLKTIRVVDI